MCELSLCEVRVSLIDWRVLSSRHTSWVFRAVLRLVAIAEGEDKGGKGGTEREEGGWRRDKGSV